MTQFNGASYKMTFCHYCNKQGHQTSDCWSKNKYLKEIKRNKDGKLTKRYIPRYCNRIIKNNEIEEERKYPKTDTRTNKKQNVNQRSKSPPIHGTVEVVKQYFYKDELKPKTKQTPKKRTVTPEIQIVREISPRKSPEKIKKPTMGQIKSPKNKCQDCLKWEFRLHQEMKNKDMEKIDAKRIVKSLTEENMKLRAERDSWKTLYMSKR